MRNLSAIVLWLASAALLAASPPEVEVRGGLVTSRSAPASEVGVQILKQGGNAIDAAVATAFALAVTYPSAGNLGGGGFAVILLASGEVVAQDHREVAPAAAHRDMYLDQAGEVIPGLSTRSHLAAGVPGSVAGLLDLLERHGTMSRQQVIAPAIRLAEEGFPLTLSLARQFERVLESMRDYPASLKKFSKAGVPYREGEVWKQPDLARTLREISKRGRDGFYKGRVADGIVAEMKRGNGLITHEDLAAYEPVWREPLRGTYRGHEIWSMPPPSSGGVAVIQMLNMMEPYDVTAMGWGSAAVIHLMVEAERRAYADRAEYLGDPDFEEVPVAQLTSKEYARQRFADFDPARASVSEAITHGTLPAESMETTHFSVADGKGNIVAFTTTLNSGYGNKIVAAGTGVLLNNEMNDFAVKRDVPNQFGLLGREANEVAPRKRMLSSMTPTIVTREGKPVLVTGSPGGSTIITTVLQVIVNVLDHGMGIGDAVSLPRFHHQWKPDMISHGAFAINPDTRRILEGMGHTRFRGARGGSGIGDANSILFREGVMFGIKDPRNEGAAIGY